MVKFYFLNLIFISIILSPGYLGKFFEDEAGIWGVSYADGILDKAHWNQAREEGGKPWAAFEIEAT